MFEMLVVSPWSIGVCIWFESQSKYKKFLYFKIQKDSYVSKSVKGCTPLGDWEKAYGDKDSTFYSNCSPTYNLQEVMFFMLLLWFEETFDYWWFLLRLLCVSLRSPLFSDWVELIFSNQL